MADVPSLDLTAAAREELRLIEWLGLGAPGALGRRQALLNLAAREAAALEAALPATPAEPELSARCDCGHRAIDHEAAPHGCLDCACTEFRPPPEPAVALPATGGPDAPRRMKANPDSVVFHNVEHDEVASCRFLRACEPVAASAGGATGEAAPDLAQPLRALYDAVRAAQVGTVDLHGGILAARMHEAAGSLDRVAAGGEATAAEMFAWLAEHGSVTLYSWPRRPTDPWTCVLDRVDPPVALDASSAIEAVRAVYEAARAVLRPLPADDQPS